MNEEPLELTRPFRLRRPGPPASQARMLTAGAAAVVAAGVVDRLVAGPGVRAFVFVAWALAFLVIASLAVRFPLSRALAFASAFVASAALTALIATSGGAASPLFPLLATLPLFLAFSAPGGAGEAIALGVATLATGIGFLLHAGAPALDVAAWAGCAATLTGFALWLGEAQRRRHDAYLEAERERAGALARLAEAERARAVAERWAAMGQIADQVAHDVNSPLGALRSSLAFAAEELAAGRGAQAEEAISDALACVERIRLIVAELGTRGGGFPRRPPDGRSG